LVASTLDGEVMLAVGSHLRRRFRRAVLGSVAFDVVRSAGTPVVVVPNLTVASK
jgi:nucleotide-binding universal stress UspA family protein